MASTSEERTANQEEPPDLNVGKLVKTRLEESLPRVLWLPLFYGVYVPLTVVGSFSWSVFWMGMPWTGFGGIVAVAYLIFGIQAAHVVIGLIVALIVVAAGVYGNLEPAQVEQVREYGSMGKAYVRYRVVSSLL